MKVQPSKLREWNTQFEFSVKYNISDCSAYPLTTEELFTIAGERACQDYLKLDLKYTETWGNSELREEISKLYSNLSIKNILATNGAIEAIFLITNNLAEPGENLIVQWPIYPALYQVAQANGIEIKRWRLDKNNGFLASLEELKGLVDKKTKAIVINQPQVPIGSVMDADMLRELVVIARENNIFIVSDEVCRPLIWNTKKIVPAVTDIYEKGIGIGDVSKPFGAGGLRIGWLASQDVEILEKCLPLRGYTTMSNSGISEFLATLILENQEKILAPRMAVAAKNFVFLKEFLRRNKDILRCFIPEGGVTAFPFYNLKVSSSQFCRGLVKRYSTLLVPGNVYEMENYFRIGFGVKQNVFEVGLNNLQEYLDSRKWGA